MRRRYRRTSRKKVAIGSERELCDGLAADAARAGFRVVPECGGWDMILVAETGEQIGVHAKLKPNVDVLAQTVQTMRQARVSPDVAAILVPSASENFAEVCRALRVVLLEASDFRASERAHGAWTMTADALRTGPRLDVSRGRCWVPSFDVALPAGVPSPKTITPWKVAAARLCIRLRSGDELTRADFVEEGVTFSTWLARGWVARVGKSRPARYVLGPHELPDVKWPEIVEAVNAARSRLA